MRSAGTPYLTLCSFALLLGANIALASEPPAEGALADDSHPPLVIAVEEPFHLPIAREGTVAASATAELPSVRYRSPLLGNDWWGPTAYVDLSDGADPHEYACSSATVPFHNGNDFGVRDFVDQDTGVFVVAAASGTVLETDDGHFDRHYEPDSEARSNFVIILNEDGSETAYWHLRKWSVLVNPGQLVFEGQPLGQVGSSGPSTGSHLHFGAAKRFPSTTSDPSTTEEVHYEPHAGTCRSGDSLWKSQLPHVFDDPIEIIWTGMTTEDPYVDDAYKFRPPDVYHVQRSTAMLHYFWWTFESCHPADTFHIIYREPDGDIHREESGTCEEYYARGHGRLSTGLWPVSPLGTYTIEFRVNEVTVSEKSFLYDDQNYQNPIAEGRTVQVAHGYAGGDLRGSDADSGLEQFSIRVPPAHGVVTLFGPRQRHFAYTAESGFEGQDAFAFQVQDAQKQISPPAVMTFEVSPTVANTLRLSDEEDYVVVPDSGSLDLSDALTLEAWIRRGTGSAGWTPLFDRSADNNTKGFQLGIAPTDEDGVDGNLSVLRFSLGDGTAATNAYGTTSIPIHRWVHVAATWDGQAMRILVDGQEDGLPVPFAGPVSYLDDHETWLGRARPDGDGFRGEIDEMRIWSVARTGVQLRSSASCDFREAPPPATLRAWWRFNGTAQDDSGHGNHGSPVPPAHFRMTSGGLDLTCAGLDTDADGVANAADNCILVANAGQVDGDGDGLGDGCDMCPTVIAGRQYDSDLDGVGDACDLCPFMPDTDQGDADADGAGDLCDPAPADPGFSVPGDGIQLMASETSGTEVMTLSWNVEPRSVSYEVYRGGTTEISARFFGACQNSRDPDPTDTSFDDDEAPQPGELWGYLVIGVDATGARGRAGVDSSGRQRDLRARDCL
jgi:hypothetical protein